MPSDSDDKRSSSRKGESKRKSRKQRTSKTKRKTKTDEEPVVAPNIVPPDPSDPTIQLVIRFESGSPLNCLFNHEGDPYARFQHLDRVTTAPVTSKFFKRYLIQLSMDLYGKPRGIQAIRKAVDLFASMAIFERLPINLYNRVAWSEDCIWFDLSNGKGEAVRIAPDGWSIEVPEDPLFITLKHQKPAIRPVKIDAADLKAAFEKFFKIVNSDPDGMLLHLAELISSFVPNIPHPIPLFYGEQGSAKTTFAAILKMLLDPSKIEVIKLSRKIGSLEQALKSHWFVPLDNVSRLTGEQSDLLCIASTGGHATKRALYTNDEESFGRVDSVVSLNGINVSATRPDLLSRCILHELPTIPESKRLLKSDLMEWFREVAPEIMGAICETLSRAMKKYPKHKKRKDLHRMADFTAWGCAIIDALGYDVEVFVDQYRKNIAKQNVTAIEEHLIGGLLLEFLEDHLPKETSVYVTTAGVLLQDLEGMASERMLRDKYFPRAANQLSRELNRLKPNMRAIGIIIDKKRTEKSRSLVFSRILKDTRFTDTKNDNDDNDDEVLNKKVGKNKTQQGYRYGKSSSLSSPSLAAAKRTKAALNAKFGEQKPAKTEVTDINKVSQRLQIIWKHAELESIDDLLLDKDMEKLPKKDIEFLTAQIDKKHVVQEKAGQWVLSETVRMALQGES